jgi:hypothetical protein
MIERRSTGATMPTLRLENPEVIMNRPAPGFLRSSSAASLDAPRKGTTRVNVSRLRLAGFAGPTIVSPL